LKNNLSKFSKFVSALLPLEGDFLWNAHRFEDEEKISILEKIVRFVKSAEQTADFDENIDKRKYSYVKGWSEQILAGLDVDKILEKLLTWEKLIMTDSLSLGDEKELLKFIQKTVSSDFNFIKVYDIARSYRHYLQIRLRHKDYQTIHVFLSKNRTDYEFSKLVNDKLHETTHDIIMGYNQTAKVTYTDSFPWLTSLLYNDNLDGYNRLLAWIRIVFIAHNTRSYEKLSEMFPYVERLVTSGKLYSRRIVTNFYSQYVLFYASMHDFEKAAYFGYLSIKEKNNDYLYYVNTLAAVLLRGGKAEKALSLLKESSATAKTAINYHNKLRHMAYTLFALIDLGMAQQAENSGFVFLMAYKKEIFEHRWHVFFHAYLKAMIVNGNYRGILKTIQQYKLLERDDSDKENLHYSPLIPWMFALALHKTGELSLEQVKDRFETLKLNGQLIHHSLHIFDMEDIGKKVLGKNFSFISKI
jgi:hypothetical protein